MNKILILIKQNKYFTVFFTVIVVMVLLIIYVLLSSPSSSPAVTQSLPTPSITASPPSQFPPLNTEEAFKKQDRSEKAFAKEQSDIDTNYPWYRKLPIQTPRYFVYFDVGKKIFVGLLYPDNASQNLIVSETVSLKAEIRKILTEQGIDVTKYEFEWIIRPENQTQ